MLFLFSEGGAGVDQRTKLLCENVFELSAMAEELQIIGSITVEDSRELFYLVLEWAEEFEKILGCAAIPGEFHVASV